MKFINTDGMVFIGPGSEWFWATLSGIVTMVSLLAIWRQLRLQASQAAIEQVDAVMHEFFSERMLNHQLALLLAMQAGVDPAHFPDGSAAAIHNYFGKLGQLTQAGHLDLKNIGSMALIGLAWWVTLEPYSRRMTATFGASSASKVSDFEWLAGKFAEVARRTGSSMTFDDAYLRDSLKRRLAITREMLRIEQSLRTVMVASPEVVTHAAPAPPVPTPPAATEG